MGLFGLFLLDKITSICPSGNRLMPRLIKFSIVHPRLSVTAIQSTHDIYEIQLQISLVISFSTKLVSDVTSEYKIRYHKGVALGD